MLWPYNTSKAPKKIKVLAFLNRLKEIPSILIFHKKTPTQNKLKPTAASTTILLHSDGEKASGANGSFMR